GGVTLGRALNSATLGNLLARNAAHAPARVRSGTRMQTHRSTGIKHPPPGSRPATRPKYPRSNQRRTLFRTPPTSESK
ncbi:hypothetical protein FGX56_00320, partial [Xylella fastidiosa subsp. multiplex]|nr:hypothetical protein [Xylella fastidiosa subsp. multiplex]